MKVIKRDGRIVEFTSDKIALALEKANESVSLQEKVKKKDIDTIIKYIESLDKKRILVEDIQDIIEIKLMEYKRYELAKKYIVYRYNRALIRKQNTTDETILGLIRKNVPDDLNSRMKYHPIIASVQRDLIAGEVSKDLTKRLLLPHKISDAHEAGILYFHEMEHFLQPIFDSCIVNIEDMLDNGTVINNKQIETPKSFQVACNIMTQIIATVASSQYGEQSVDIRPLGKYLRISYFKFKKELTERYKDKLSDDLIEKIIQDRIKYELSSGVQTIQYQLNTLMSVNGKSPSVTLFLSLEEDEYIEEVADIIEEILTQRYEGIKNENGISITPTFPKLVYVLGENNTLSTGKYDYLTRLAIQCSKKRLYPNFISAKKMKELYDGNIMSPVGKTKFLPLYKDEKGEYQVSGRFTQGTVTLNLPKIALLSKQNEKSFFEILENHIELCFEALMCRHYVLLSTLSDISPVHWKYGAIARLKTGEKINQLLKNGYSTLSLGYIGIYEMTKFMTGLSHSTKTGKEFAIKVMKYLKQATENWKKQTGITFTLYATPCSSVGKYFIDRDKEYFDEIKELDDIQSYTNSFYLPENENLSLYERLQIEEEFQILSTGGAISIVPVEEIDNDIEKFISFIYENILYVGFSTKILYCNECGFQELALETNKYKFECPNCKK